MTKQEELKTIKQLTGASRKQIRLIETGWTSRIYLVDDGCMVFKFPRNKKEQENFDHEIKVLKIIREHHFNLKTPIIKWCGEHNEYIGFYGVPGVPLTPETLNLLDDKQKETLGRQIGIFLKQLHRSDFEGKSFDKATNIPVFLMLFYRDRKDFAGITKCLINHFAHDKYKKGQ
jgi:hypothetical protein